MRTPHHLVLVVALAAGCSSGAAERVDSAPNAARSGPAAESASPGPDRPAGTRPAPSRAAASTSTAPAASARPLATTAPGRPAVRRATAPGRYLLDSSGTVTVGDPGVPQQAGGLVTLTVSPPQGDLQHSALHSEQASTEQDVLVRDGGTWLVSLVLSSTAFPEKEFRPERAVLLVPDPAAVGTKWGWSATSTDGLTTVRNTSSVPGTETVSVGGRSVACVKVQTRLVLSGDVDYTADITTWWAPSLRLPVKERQVGRGTYQGVPFTSDLTSLMRSVTPS